MFERHTASAERSRRILQLAQELVRREREHRRGAARETSSRHLLRTSIERLRLELEALEEDIEERRRVA